MSERSSEVPPEADVIPDSRSTEDIVAPPRRLLTIMKQVGPGLIIAANIVGSGELIMTTKTGAEAGIALLWLILLGCVVKVFVQLELGRFTISHGETTLSALTRVPGPRVGRVNWVVLFWGFMILTTVGQLGGIVGGVGQALALTLPVTGDVQLAVSIPSETDIRALADWEQSSDRLMNIEAPHVPANASSVERAKRQMEWVQKDMERLGDRGVAIMELARSGQPFIGNDGENLVSFPTKDDKIWVVIIGVLTSGILYVGRYRLIERFSVILVSSFSIITIGNVASLQMTDRYRLSAEQIMSGLSFGFPDGPNAMVTALATFGIIGVGATELISYPYWCLEKGYARSVGPRDESDAWLHRARGWFTVMKFDAFASMVIYTFATAAFYLMGVAVLHSEGRNPEGTRMVSTLAQSYVPVFGSYARWLFLSGAIAVLYSTYLVANAAKARMVADFFGVAGLASRDPDSPQRARMVSLLSVVLPLACVVAYILIPSPVALVATAGIAQAIMLPMIGFSSIYFRYRETDQRLRPGKIWDLCLVLSSLTLLIAGCWGVFATFSKFVL